MKKYMLIRFGVQRSKEIEDVIIKNTEKNSTNMLIVHEGTFITIFSSSTKVDILNKELSSVEGDKTAHFLIEVTKYSVGYNFPLDMSEKLKAVLELDEKSFESTVVDRNKNVKEQIKSKDIKSTKDFLKSFTTDELKSIIVDAEQDENYELCKKIKVILLERQNSNKTI